MVEVRDAVDECNRWARTCDELERQRIELLVALKDVVAIAPMDTLRDTKEGRDAVNLLRRIEPDFIKGCGL